MTATYVYLCLDTKGRPLYVGCTSDVERRMKEHRMYAKWWANEVAQVLVVDFPTRKEALAAETERIQFKALARHEWITEFNRVNGFDAA